eukprot:maker-scaffold168_size293125-snap-gene-0.17 protein:Tk04445 transcript:maker-scaffold168_size293125-snap-gene-0.17-mRNA-1 annotation:"hypothetical protein L798_07469"
MSGGMSLSGSSSHSLADLGVSVTGMDTLVSSHSTAWIPSSVSDSFATVVVSDASLVDPMLLPLSSVLLPGQPGHVKPMLGKLQPDENAVGPLLEIVKSPFLHFEGGGGTGMSTGYHMPAWEPKCPSDSNYGRHAKTLATPTLAGGGNFMGLAHHVSETPLLTSHPKTLYMVTSDIKGNSLDPGLSIKLLDELPHPAPVATKTLTPMNILMPSAPNLMAGPATNVSLNSNQFTAVGSNDPYHMTKLGSSSQDVNLSFPGYDMTNESMDLALSFPSLSSPTAHKMKQSHAYSTLDHINLRCVSEAPFVCHPSPGPSRVVEEPMSLFSQGESVRLLPGTRDQMPSASPQVRILPHKTAMSDPQYHFQLMENPTNLTPIRIIPQISPNVTTHTNISPLKQAILHDGASAKGQYRNKLVLMPEQTLRDATPKGQAKLYLKQIFNGSVSSISVPVSTPGKGKEPRNLVQPISCFKCSECGFLGMTAKQIEDHAIFEHEADSNEDSEEWLSVAQREGIKLECPFCPNKFNAEGSRSFKVHVLDDHGVNETEAEKQFRECHQKRRNATLEWMKKKRAEEREERRRARRDVLEAYVDDNGELRVRNVRKGKRSCPEDTPSSSAVNQEVAQSVDVSAHEYVDALTIGKKMAKAKKVGLSPEETIPAIDDRQKLLIGLSHKSKRKSVLGNVYGSESDGSTEDDEEDDADIDIETLAPLGVQDDSPSSREDDPASASGQAGPRRKVGRPMGSRTVGLTKLKRMNRNIELSNERMGVECGIHACATRFKCPDKLSYHRRCHGSLEHLSCLECKDTFEHWKPLALHLWSKHKIDMELLKCDHCEEFRSFSLARLQAHKICHSSDRSFLCDDCGKGFKTSKNLRHHQEIHLRKAQPEKNPPKFPCQVCQRPFREFRLLRHHMNIVHEKLRPHLCNYCGYSASSKSSLKLHLRLHTGEKPYSCPECDYKSADHNSLRRHKLRHSGEKPYKCPYCDYSSIQSCTYMVHLKNKHPKEATAHVYHCDQCVFKTVKEGNFLAHLAEHKQHSSESATRVQKAEVKSETADSTTPRLQQQQLLLQRQAHALVGLNGSNMAAPDALD